METHHNIPPTHPPYTPQIRRYQDGLQAQHGLRFDDYHALWRWSITDLDAFWQSIWDYLICSHPRRTARYSQRT